MSVGIKSSLEISPADQYAEWVREQIRQAQALADAMAKLQEQIAQGGGDLAKLKEQEAALQKQITDVMAKLAKMDPKDKDRDALEKQLAALQSQLGDLVQKIDTLQAALTAYSAQLAQDKEALNALNQGMTTSFMQQVVSDARASEAHRQAKEDPAPLLAGANDFFERLGKMVRENNKESDASVGDNAPKKASNSMNMVDKGDHAVEDFAQAAADMAKLQVILGKQAEELIKEISDLETNVKNAEARKQELENKKTELAIELGAACASFLWGGAFLIPYLSVLIDNCNKELDQLDKDIAADKQKIVEKKAELTSVMSQLTSLDRKELASDIKNVEKLVSQLMGIMQSGGAISPEGMKKAAELLVQILSLLQVIIAKVGTKKAEDEEWMSKGTTAQYQMSLNQTVITSKNLADLQAHAAFMKAVMTAAQAAMIAASIAMAGATGGTSAALVAAGMGILMAAGVFDKISEAIESDLKKAGCPEAKLVADAITTVIAVVITFGLAGVQSLAQQGGRVVAQSLAKQGAERMAAEMAKSFATQASRIGTEAVVRVGNIEAQQIAQAAATSAYKETVMMAARTEARECIVAAVTRNCKWVASNEVRQRIAEQAEAAAVRAATTAAENAPRAIDPAMVRVLSAEAADAAAQAVRLSAPPAAAHVFSFAAVQEGALQTAKDIGVKGAIASGVAAYMSTNGLVDFAEMMARKSTNKSKEDLENDPTWQWIKIVTQIVQMIAQMYAMSKIASSKGPAGEGQLGELEKDLLSKESRQKLMQLIQGMQLVGDGVTAYSNFKLMNIMFNMSDGHKRLAGAEAEMTILQSSIDHLKKIQQDVGDVRAGLFEEQMKGLNQTIQAMGEAEREAANLIRETAV